jgi:hypothetical protein
MAVREAWMRLPEAGWRLPENPGGLHPEDDGSGRKMAPPDVRMGFHEAGWRPGKLGYAFRKLENRPGAESGRPDGTEPAIPGKSAVREA